MISKLLIVRVESRAKHFIEEFEEKVLFCSDTEYLRVVSVKELSE